MSTLIMLDGGHEVQVGSACPDEIRTKVLECEEKGEPLRAQGAIIDPRKIIALVSC